MLARIICAPVSRSRPGSTPFTVPCVPTGMNAGVSTTPCGVVNRAQPRASAGICVQNVEARMPKSSLNSARE